MRKWDACVEWLRANLARLHPDHTRIARAALWLFVFTFIAKLAGAGREIAIAWRFGRGPEVDAYNLAIMLSLWLPLTIYSVMTVVLVPALVRLRSARKPQDLRFSREVTGAAVALGVFLSVATWMLAPALAQAFAAELPRETGQLAQGMLRSFAPLALLTLLIAAEASRLQAAQDHRYALAEGFPPLAVGLFVVAWTSSDTLPLIVGTLAGFAWQTWWLARHARDPSGGSRRMAFGLRAPHWSELWRGALAMGAGHFAMSFIQPIDQWFAAGVGTGAIATLGYTNRVIALGMALGATVISRATLPVFAEGVARGDAQLVRTHALSWAGWMLLVGMVAAGVLWLLSPWLVAILFERGAFSPADTQAVAEALRWGVWQLPPYLAGLVLVSQLASEGRYSVIGVIAFLNITVKGACTSFFVDHLGLTGILLATVVMYSVAALSFWCAVVSGPRRNFRC